MTNTITAPEKIPFNQRCVILVLIGLLLVTAGCNPTPTLVSSPVIETYILIQPTTPHFPLLTITPGVSPLSRLTDPPDQPTAAETSTPS
jgi:hypothetical protein